MPGSFDNVATLVAPLRDVLLLVLGALVTLLSTLIVQHKKAGDELRVRILSGTVERLAQVEDLVALILTQLGRQSFKPLMMALGSPGFPSPETAELEAAAAKLKLLVHSFRRYPMLTVFVFELVRATENLLHVITTGSLLGGEELAKELVSLQDKVSTDARVIHNLIDRITDTGLRTDLTLPARVEAWARRAARFLRLEWETVEKHEQTHEG